MSTDVTCQKGQSYSSKHVFCPIRDLRMFLCFDQSLWNLSSYLDFEFRIFFGPTRAIVLLCINKLLRYRIQTFKYVDGVYFVGIIVTF